MYIEFFFAFLKTVDVLANIVVVHKTGVTSMTDKGIPNVFTCISSVGIRQSLIEFEWSRVFWCIA